ncbi:MAG: NAD(P)-binding domain-containing protein [Actinomycetota bacterium]
MTTFAVLGTGVVGRVIATNLVELGHQVFLGTRNPSETNNREDLAKWLGENTSIELLTFFDAAHRADAIVNALPGHACLEVFTSLVLSDAKSVTGKTVIDISNPLDFSQGFPPTLFVKDTDSLAEQIQRTIPTAKVVKTLNTMTADWMIPRKMDPSKELSVFLSSDDEAAKNFVKEILQSFGHRDIIDIGDLSSARAAEMLLPMWLRLSVAMNSYSMNFKIIR